MLERYLLRYFLAVAEQASFSRAAQQCCVSQPTLSVGIAKLEEMLKIPLFVRSNRQVRLTAAGTRLLEHARRIEKEFNLAQMAVTSDDMPRSVKLGVLTSIPGEQLARIVALTRAQAPAERFELVPGSAREIAAKLAQGRIDLALTTVTGEAGRFPEQPLRIESYVLMVPSTHHHADRGTIAAEEVAADVMIVRRHCEALPIVSRHFTERGIRPHFALRTNNDERVMQMVGAGLGVTVMPDSYHAADVRALRLSGFVLRRTLGLVSGSPNPLDASSSGLVRAVVETIGDASPDPSTAGRRHAVADTGATTPVRSATAEAPDDHGELR